MASSIELSNKSPGTQTPASSSGAFTKGYADSSQQEEEERFRPYTNTVIDTPLIHLVTEPVKGITNPILRFFYRIRWFFSYPLNSITVYPKCLPACPSFIPWVKYIPYVTLGELLFTLPLILILVLSINNTFVDPHVKGSGSIAAWPIYATFLTAAKTNSLFSFVLGVPFERMINWHLACAVLACLTGCFHYYVAFNGEDGGGGGSHDRRLISSQDGTTSEDYNYGVGEDEEADADEPFGDWHDSDYQHRALSGDSKYAAGLPDQDFVKFSFDSGVNQSGTLLVLCLLAITLPSLFPLLRRWFFEIFYYSHLILAVGVITFAVMHSVSGLIYIAIVWGIDLAMRYVIMAGCYPHKASLRILPANVIELSFPKPSNFRYKPGQFVMLCIPKLSIFEFHPFSISSAPHQEVVTIHIRVLGDWTGQLAKLARKRDQVTIWMEGPYGNLAVDLDNDNRYKMVLLISGGIGITPMQSVCNGLIHDHLQKGRKLKTLYFVWSVREFGMVEALNDDGGGTTVPGGKRLSDTTHHKTSPENHNLPDELRLDDLSFQPDLLERLGSAKRLDIDPSHHDAGTLMSADAEGKKDSEIEVEIEDPASHNKVAVDSVPSPRSEDDFLHTEFYLTGLDHPSEHPAFHSPYVKLGRPNIDKIIRKIKIDALEHKEKRVAVCVCGPPRLVDACREACRKHSDLCGGVKFDFHEETFEF